MAVRAAAACLLTTVRLELGNSSNSKKENGKKDLGNRIGPSKNSTLPLFSVSKPSWVVKTESNVWKETRKKPDPPCVVCKGSGRVACHHCSGTGRTNYTHLAMLPKGKWPKWCRTCHGSGLDYCSRCLGTGEYRYIMGFRFMKMDSEDTRGQKNHQHDCRPRPDGAAEHFLDGGHVTSN